MDNHKKCDCESECGETCLCTKKFGRCIKACECNCCTCGNKSICPCECELGREMICSTSDICPHRENFVKNMLERPDLIEEVTYIIRNKDKNYYHRYSNYDDKYDDIFLKVLKSTEKLTPKLADACVIYDTEKCSSSDHKDIYWSIMEKFYDTIKIEDNIDIIRQITERIRYLSGRAPCYYCGY